MKRTKFLWMILLALLIGCSSEVEIRYNFSQPVEYQLYREGTYSTQNQVGEVVGTLTRWWLDETLFPRDGGAVWSRKFNVQKNEGYHRHSLPSELVLRLPVRADVDSRSLSEIRGLSRFEEDVVELLPVRRHFKEPLRKGELLKRFQSEAELWWRATHLLQGKVPKRGKITQQIAAAHGGAIDLRPLQVDSVVALGQHKVEGRNCFNYKIYYKLDSPPDIDLLFEQFRAADSTDRIAYEGFKPLSGKATGSWGIWISPEDGTLCREQDWRELSIVVAHQESGEAKEVMARTAIEQLYTYDLAEQQKKMQRTSGANR